MKLKYAIIPFLLSPGISSQTVESIDFEGGGFVLAQIPTPDGNTIYARTDVGGVYKKVGNDNWKFISEFAVTQASLMVQAIDVNPNNPNEVLAACGMDYLADDDGRGLWKTEDGGSTWRQVLGPQTGHPELNYGGNIFRLKLGSPCATWNPSVSGRIITGGLAEPSGRPSVYLSDDDGSTWRVISSNSSITGSVVSIQIHPKYPDMIWVGTDKGLWITKDNGATWSDKIFPAQIEGVYQMLLKDNGKGGVTGFVSTNNLYRLESDAASITDLTPKFGTYSGYGMQIIGLNFVDFKEDAFIATMMGSPCKITRDDGETWSKEMDFILEREYNPKHCLNTEDKIYCSNILAFQNPVNKDTWYMSGGSGPFITTNRGKSFRYNGNGINMVVVYDVNFSPLGDIYMSISDWGMVKTDDAHYPKVIDYSRKYTLDPPPPENNGDSYIPNISRVFISKINPNRIYLAGGSVFTYYPALAKSESRGEPNTYKIMTPPGIPCYPTTGPGLDAVISDGSMSSDGTNDCFVLVMGGGLYNHKISDADWYGIYYTLNGGASFEKSTFVGNADNIYKNSFVGGLFSVTDYIEVDPLEPNRFYFYIEGGNESGVYAGGLFTSVGYGRTFIHTNYVVSNPAVDYRSKGTIELNPKNGELWIGIRNYGLFKSVDKGGSFTKIPGFKSIYTVDCCGNDVGVFGMQDGDSYNKIYLSRDNGNSWQYIYLPGHGVIPSVRKFDFREDKPELWISTAGQGLFVYKY